MSILSDDTRNYWAWIVQREYKCVLECYLHIEDDEVRRMYEQELIKRLDEYTIFLLHRSFAQQIELNKKMKICDPTLPNPYERYPELFNAG